MILTALYDSKTQRYFNFVTTDNPQRIKREYALLFKNGQHNSLVDFPEDYILVQLGFVDDVSGDMQSNLVNICQLVELKPKEVK